MIENSITFLFLVIGSAFDLKGKCVPKSYLYLWGGCAFLYLISVSVIENNFQFIINVIIGIIPGVIGLFLAFVSKEQIGWGDGWVILLMGIFVGAKMVCGIVFVAFVFLTFVIIVLLLAHRVKRRTTIPFIPFLLVGQIVVVCIGG